MKVTELRTLYDYETYLEDLFRTLSRITLHSSKRLSNSLSKSLVHLEKDELQALVSPKEKLISPMALSFPKQNGHSAFDRNVHDNQVGWVLLADENNVKMPSKIGNWSRTLTKPKRNQRTTNHKCFTAVLTIMLLHVCFERAIPTLRMNPHTTRWKINLAVASDRIAHWTLWLLKFDFKFCPQGWEQPARQGCTISLPTTCSDRIMLEIIYHVCLLLNLTNKPWNIQALTQLTALTQNSF